jgi:hypothetical protein
MAPRAASATSLSAQRVASTRAAAVVDARERATLARQYLSALRWKWIVLAAWRSRLLEPWW